MKFPFEMVPLDTRALVSKAPEKYEDMMVFLACFFFETNQGLQGLQGP